MVAVQYATLADLTGAMPDDLTLPSDAARLVVKASQHIDRWLLTHGAVYDVDSTTDLPTDADITTALKDAAVAQALWWIETGDERGFASVVKSASPGGGGPTYSGGIQRTAPDAVDILATATDTAGTPLLCGPWQY